jgi:hypothetical protein
VRGLHRLVHRGDERECESIQLHLIAAQSSTMSDQTNHGSRQPR